MLRNYMVAIVVIVSIFVIICHLTTFNGVTFHGQYYGKIWVSNQIILFLPHFLFFLKQSVQLGELNWVSYLDSYTYRACVCHRLKS
jgi:hypothetical protein